jgi:hypothetical protein
MREERFSTGSSVDYATPTNAPSSGHKRLPSPSPFEDKTLRFALRSKILHNRKYNGNRGRHFRGGLHESLRRAMTHQNKSSWISGS